MSVLRPRPAPNERARSRGGVWRFGAGAAASLCALVGSLATACQPLHGFGASAIVNAPNRGDPRPPFREGEMTVSVGPPPATLSLEIVDAPAPRGTVFVLHGIRADREAVRAWGDWLAAAGFRVILVDLRGHGRSSGDFLSYGVVESRDLVQVLDAVESRGLRAGAVGVMGLSYGGATAIEWAGIDPRVAAVVAVASFASLREVVPGYAPPLLPRSFITDAIDLAGRRGGFDPDDASPVRAITRTRAAVLLIHGLDDRRIPAWHSQHIFDARADRTELLLLSGVGHGSVAGDPLVRARAPAWFARYLDP